MGPPDPKPSGASDLANEQIKRPTLLWLLTLLIAAESVLLAAAGVAGLATVVSSPTDSSSTLIALIVLAFVVTLGLAAMTVGLVARRRWARSGAITWQVLQALVAVGAFQGLYAAPAFGWGLLVPAIAALALAFTPQVVAATRS